VRHSAEHLAGWLVFFAFLLPGLGATVPRGIRAGGVPLNGTARRSSLPLRVAAAFCSLPPRPASAPCRRGRLLLPAAAALLRSALQRATAPRSAARGRPLLPAAAALCSRAPPRPHPGAAREERQGGEGLRAPRSTGGEAGRGGAPWRKKEEAGVEGGGDGRGREMDEEDW